MVGQVPFSSRRRWSALDLGDERLVLGAPERFAAADPALVEQARDGGRSRAPRARARPLRRRRCRAAARSRRSPPTCGALGLVVLAERLRPNAAETVAFFAAEDVDLKVLSGDAPATVGAIARDAGVPGSTPALDGEALPSEPAALREAVLSAPAVGRISPGGQARGRGRAHGRRSLRGDGRRRGQRRPRAQAGAPGDRAGLGRADGALGRRPRARARRLRGRAGDGGRGPPDPAQHPARRAALRDQVGVHRGAGAGGGDSDRDLPAPPAPVHDRLHGHDRHPRLRARAGAQLRPVAAGALPPVGRALRHPGRDRDRDRDRRRLPARALRLRPRPGPRRARSRRGSWSPAGSPS